jgi:heptosyltransferase I
MKILIVKTSSLGDIIQCFPALDYLRRKFPDAQIDWVVESHLVELVKANPQVNSVLAIDSKQWRKRPVQLRKEFFQSVGQLRKVRYELLFDLQGNMKSSLLVLLARAKKKIGFGFKTVHEWPNAFFTSYRINPPKEKNIREDYLGVVKGFFNDSSEHQIHPVTLKLEPLQQQKLTALFAHVQKKPTLVCPSSAWPNKCLSEEMLIALLKKIGRGPYWFIWGSQKERESALKLSSSFQDSIVLERLSLPLLQHVMAHCQLVVAMDSLPLHLCGTTATPTLSFFGPSSAHKFVPLGSHHCAIQGACPYGEHFEKTCPKLRTCPTGLCLKLPENFDRWTETASRAGF